MNCKRVQSQLGAFLDREMTGTETLAIREHLNACESCRTEADDLARLKTMMGALPDPEPAADFEERLLRAVRAERPVERVAAPRWKPIVGFLGVAAASMAVTLTILSSSQSKPIVSSGPQKDDIEFQVARDEAFNISDPSRGMTYFSVEHASR
ncbi:hypothetical protein EON81_00880 [bacterium]|nr:MAG: hypothetical protein EON81_00880 [bacterium]